MNWARHITQYFRGELLAHVQKYPATVPQAAPLVTPETVSPEELVANMPDVLFFLVAGMTRNWTRDAYQLNLPSGTLTPLLKQTPYNFNAIGRVDLLLRLFNGYDPKLVPVIQNIENFAKDAGVPYQLPLATMTMQDAIDLSIFCISASTIERFVNSTISTNGVHIGDVGGPVDIIALSSRGAEWVQRKTLHIKRSPR